MSGVPVGQGEDKLEWVDLPPAHQQALDDAIREYRQVCADRGLSSHAGSVHSFGDTYKQARALVTMARTTDEVRRIALMCCLEHRFDDAIDPHPENLSRLAAEDDVVYADLDAYLPEDARQVKQLMTPLARDPLALERSVMAMVYGALVQHAGTAGHQQHWLERFHRYILSGAADAEIRHELEQLHPLQTYLTCHTALEVLFSMEADGGVDKKPLAGLWNLAYAPMLYRHNHREEATEEGLAIRHGTEYCNPNGASITDAALTELLDVFDRHVHRMHDARKPRRFQQFCDVYEVFQPLLTEKSPTLRDRYEQTRDNLLR